MPKAAFQPSQTPIIASSRRVTPMPITSGDSPAFNTRSRTTQTPLLEILTERQAEMSAREAHDVDAPGQLRELSLSAAEALKDSRGPSTPPPIYQEFLLPGLDQKGFPNVDFKRVRKLPNKQAINIALGIARRKLKKARKHLDRSVSTSVRSSEEEREWPTLRVSSTGWSGKSSGCQANLSSQTLVEKNVEFIPHSKFNLRGLSKEGLQLFVRTGTPSEYVPPALARLVKFMNQDHIKKAFMEKPGRRGKHSLCLVGVTRGYETELHFTHTSRSTTPAQRNVLKLLYENKDLQDLSRHVSTLLKTWYPAVYERYKEADPGTKDSNDPYRCRFGVFPLFCFNYSSTDDAVHCNAHTDWKNVAGGICVVMPYGDFDSKKKHYLLFHELGVALEVPAGVAVLYPSALLRHENCDRPGEIVEAESEEGALRGEGIKRGSLVWFAQANYIISCELGQTLKQFGPGKAPKFGSINHLFMPRF